MQKINSEKLPLPRFGVELDREKFVNLMETMTDYLRETLTDPTPVAVARVLLRSWDNDARTLMKNNGWSVDANTYDEEGVKQLKDDMALLLCKHMNFGKSFTDALHCKQKPNESMIQYVNRFVPIWSAAPFFNYTLDSKERIEASNFQKYLAPNAWVEGIEDEGLKSLLKLKSNHPKGSIREYVQIAQDLEVERGKTTTQETF